MTNPTDDPLRQRMQNETRWCGDCYRARVECTCADRRAALAAAPQPAPERDAGRAEGWAEAARFLETLKGVDLDGNEFDLPADEWRVTALLGVRACAVKLDALLARGLLLPGGEAPLCSICAKPCDTTENRGPEVQLHNDLWCCSRECYERHPEGGLRDEQATDFAAGQAEMRERAVAACIVTRQEQTDGGWRSEGMEMARVLGAAIRALPIKGTQAPPETMAWAVVGEDGKIIPASCAPIRPKAVGHRLFPEDRIVRVAIRVVEGGDE